MKRAPQRRVALNGFAFGNEEPLALIAGPCVIEDAAFTVRIAKSLAATARARRLPYVFKA